MTSSDVLVLRALGLGDFVTGLPALRLVRDALPGRRIVLAAPRSLVPLCPLTGTVDALVQAHELSPIIDPPSRPELAIDLHGNGPRSRALLEPCRPRTILAYSGSDVPWLPDEHEVERWCRLARVGLGLDDAPTPELAGALRRPEGPSPRPSGTVLHCGAKSASRRWPWERFADVAVQLRSAGHDVVITGGPGEMDIARRIAHRAQVPALTSLSLLELIALVADARLVVCGDTGVAHVASAFRTPSVVLFGPVSPTLWGPPPDPRHVVLWHGDGSGDPHGAELDPALDRITVDEVVAGAALAVAGRDG